MQAGWGAASGGLANRNDVSREEMTETVQEKETQCKAKLEKSNL